MSASPTPRTDAVAIWKHTTGLYRVVTTGTVDVEFARQLERELAEAQKRIIVVEKQANDALDKLDAWRNCCEELAAVVQSSEPTRAYLGKEFSAMFEDRKNALQYFNQLKEQPAA